MAKFVFVFVIIFLYLQGHHVTFILGDIGTAGEYNPPYGTIQCSNIGDLPVNGYFMEAGSAIWDNGAACGRRYQVRCLSGPRRPCRDGFVIVEVVSSCSNRKGHICPTVSLANKAFDALSKIPNVKINIEYQQI